MPIANDPPDLPATGADSIFSYENLPEKHWKKYIYAARFVQMVRAKTPKVTYYSDKAKCQLMETLEDYEATFYDGSKITKTAQDGIKIDDGRGTAESILPLDLKYLDGSKKILFEHFQQTYEHCLSIERALSAVKCNANPNDECFPLIIGRRPNPTTVSSTSSSSSLKENTNYHSNMSTPRTPNVSYRSETYHKKIYKFSFQMPSFATSVNSHMSSSRTGTMPSKSSNFSNIAVKKCNIPGIGTAVQLSQGVIQVQYLDGSKLSIIPPEQGGGVSYAQFPNAPLQHFSPDDDQLPAALRDRIEQMPVVLKNLKMTSAPSIPYNFVENNTPKTPMSRFLR